MMLFTALPLAPTVSVLTVEMAPAVVVVALPFTIKVPPTDTGPVVEAFWSEARPATLTVLERIAAPETVSKLLVNLPVRTVELAVGFDKMSLLPSVSDVVVAPPRKVARPLTVSKLEVNLPDRTVELADGFVMVSPFNRVSDVVVAPPRKVARPAMLMVPLPVVLIAPVVVILVPMVVTAAA